MNKIQINYLKKFILLVIEESPPFLPLSGVITHPERLSPQLCSWSKNYANILKLDEIDTFNYIFKWKMPNHANFISLGFRNLSNAFSR